MWPAESMCSPEQRSSNRPGRVLPARVGSEKGRAQGPWTSCGPEKEPGALEQHVDPMSLGAFGDLLRRESWTVSLNEGNSGSLWPSEAHPAGHSHSPLLPVSPAPPLSHQAVSFSPAAQVSACDSSPALWG